MKLSVIIPCYNQEELVIRAIESIPIRDDIEIIVIDDGSTDKTWKNLFIYQKFQNNKIKLLRNNKNMGVSYALNKGYDIATGEYVVLLGSDDYFITDKFKKVIDNELTGEDLIYFDLELNNGDKWRLIEETKHLFCGSVKFMKREFIGDTRCPVELRTAEDKVFYEKLMKKKPKEKFLNIVLKHYNHPRKGSLSDIGGE